MAYQRMHMCGFFKKYVQIVEFLLQPMMQQLSWQIFCQQQEKSFYLNAFNQSAGN